MLISVVELGSTEVLPPTENSLSGLGSTSRTDDGLEGELLPPPGKLLPGLGLLLLLKNQSLTEFNKLLISS